MTQNALLQHVSGLTQTHLLPLTQAIDRQGVYPEDFMHLLGEQGGFAALGDTSEGGSGLGLFAQMALLREIGRTCGSTAFSAWCQSACAWYLHLSPNQAVRERYLADVLTARVLAGTGMSNTVKHLSGHMEKLLLQAERTEGGYLVSGTLPWVSNVGERHIWACTAQLDEADGGGYVMFITGGQQHGISLHDCPPFCALEGTRTQKVQFEQVFVPHADVLAEPEQFFEFAEAIKPGFILLQIGFGCGVVDAALAQIAESDRYSASINQYLPQGHQSLKAALDEAWSRAEALAQQAWAGAEIDRLALLKLRADTAELALAAAQSSALHSGARGYLMSSPVQRHSREAMFVAIVTASLKQLRMEIATWKQAA